MGPRLETGALLAQRARDLSGRAASELLAGATSELQDLLASFDAARKAADQALAAEELRFADASDRAKAEGDRLRAVIRDALMQLDSVEAEITAGLGSVSSAPAANVQTQAHLGAGALAAAAAEIQKRATAARQLKVPALWPASTAGQVAVLGSLLLGLVTWPLAMLWPITIATWNVVARLEQRREYGRLYVELHHLRHSLAALQSRVSQFETGELDAAKLAILQPARKAHQQAFVSSERLRATRLERLTQSVSALTAELTAAATALRQQLRWAALPWDAPEWSEWTPPQRPLLACQIGTLNYADPALDQALGVATSVSVPAVLSLQLDGCIVMRAAPHDKAAAEEALRSCIFRLLATSPPGAVRFVLIDPVGFGRNVSDLMALGDVSKDLVGEKAWSEPSQIEEQLRLLSEHVETVIQRQLRKDHDSLVDYNASIGRLAEPYRFLIVFDYPSHFTDLAIRRLAGIVRNGPQCGVYSLIFRDSAQQPRYGLRPDDALGNAQWIDKGAGSAWRWSRAHGDPQVELDDTGKAKIAVRTVTARWAERAQSAELQIVPFPELLKAARLSQNNWWKSSALNSLKVAIGFSGQRVQHLELGVGIAHNVLIGGAIGSGKTNLLHVLVASACLALSPVELSLYLVDLKSVGFNEFARGSLPHAAVVAVDADREFGLSVLIAVEEVMRDRTARFNEAGAAEYSAYRTKRPADVMPRVLVVIDEFQELLSGDDRVAVQARRSLEHLGRMGRGFGIHLILASQTLSSTAHLPSALLGQINVRVALKARDADSRLILGGDNGAASGLSQGEAIYNADGGAVAGNEKCQVALFRSEVDLPLLIRTTREMADAAGFRGQPVVFDGANAPRLERCLPLCRARAAARWATTDVRATAWLGEPIGVDDPVAAVFERRASRNLLVVAPKEEDGVGVLLAAWVSLMCQHKPASARFHVLDLASPGGGCRAKVLKLQETFSHQIELLDNLNAAATVVRLNAAIASRQHNRGNPLGMSEYLIVFGLHRATSLTDDPAARTSLAAIAAGPGQAGLAALIRGGPDVGVHALAWSDTVRNTRRAIGRDLADFGLRVAGPLSAEESNVLLESAEATRLNRAGRLLFWDSDAPSETTKFRPYAIDDAEWTVEYAAEQRFWSDPRSVEQ